MSVYAAFPAAVVADGEGVPRAVGAVSVEAVREEWVVEDRWWTRPLRRRYFELALDDGRRGGLSGARGRALVLAAGVGLLRVGYVELHCHSAYSFLDGASSPAELAATAAAHGHDALAITDHDGLWGAMEFAHACKGVGVRPITGAEITVENPHPTVTRSISRCSSRTPSDIAICAGC